MAQSTICFMCKKPIKRNEAQGYTYLRGHFHKSCAIKGTGALSFLVKPMFFIFDQKLQMQAQQIGMLFGIASFIMVLLFGAVMFLVEGWVAAFMVILLGSFGSLSLALYFYGTYSSLKAVK